MGRDLGRSGPDPGPRVVTVGFGGTGVRSPSCQDLVFPHGFWRTSVVTPLGGKTQTVPWPLGRVRSDPQELWGGFSFTLGPVSSCWRLFLCFHRGLLVQGWGGFKSSLWGVCVSVGDSYGLVGTPGSFFP